MGSIHKIIYLMLECTFYTFPLCINDLHDDVVCNIAVYADTTPYSKCDQASDLWQQLKLAFELESDL